MQQAASVQGQGVQSAAAAEGVVAGSVHRDTGARQERAQLLQRVHSWAHHVNKLIKTDVAAAICIVGAQRLPQLSF